MSEYSDSINWKGKLTRTQISKLEQLYSAARIQEQAWNDQCKQILNLIDPNVYGTLNAVGHGAYIKLFYTYFYQPSQRVSSGAVAEGNIYQQAEHILDTLNLDSTIFTNIGKQIGAQALIEYLDENLNKGSFHFARGNYGELRVLEGLYNSAKQVLKNKANNHIKAIALKDTDDRKFGESIKYDILLTVKPEAATKINTLSIPIEVKSGRRGIDQNFRHSNFYLGTVSDTAFDMNKKTGIYQQLIESLQDAFLYFLDSNQISTTKIDSVIQQMMIETAIQYIYWRLQNNFPIFVSDKIKNGQPYINLSSEIIRGFLEDPGGTVIYTLKDVFRFVDLDSSLAFVKGQRGVRAWNEAGILIEEYQRNSQEWQAIDYQLLSNTEVLNRSVKVSPQFKATIQYGI